MFGSFRFILALMVLTTHIGGIEVVAGIAVWGFFMLSGFLMTAILNNKYGFSPVGLVYYAKSRAMRLLPTYWFLVILTAIIIFFYQYLIDPRLINDALAIPVNVRDVLSNLLIVGHTTLGIGRITNALSPSAWAVDVEILMYACSCFCLARSERLTRVILFVLLTSLPLLWLTAKYLITQGQMVLANQLIYSFLPTALIPYTIGTYLWFVRGRISPSWTSPGVCLTSFIMLFVCALGISRVSVTIAYAASLPFLAFVIIGLSRYNKSGLIEKMDTLLGRMSYPLYLTQWLCAYVVVLFFSQSTALFIVSNNHIRFTSSGFLAVLAVVLLGSLFLAIFIEGPVEDLRHRLIARVVHDRSKKESI